MSTQIVNPLTQQANILKKYSLIMTQPVVQSVSADNEVTVITGTTGFIIQGNTHCGQNRVIPNFNEPIKGCLELNTDSKTVELESEISLDEAKNQVLDYLREHTHAKTSEIIIDLCLDPALVVEALNKLKEEDIIEGNDVQAINQPKQSTE